MDTLIDWLSFTVQIGKNGIPVSGWKWEDIQWHIEEFLGESIIGIFTGDGWEDGHGRRPYAHSFRSTSRGVTVFWSGKLSHALIELSGAGVQNIRVQGRITELLTACKDRVTRLDIATDIETDVRPSEFARQRNVARFKSHGSFQSRDGSTEYIGSRTSERYARVYRYDSPHPRAHLLRVEHEIKGETARAAVAFLLLHGVEELQRDLGVSFGWCHPLWQPDAQAISSLALPARHREDAKTEIWLRTQVAAAFKKLVASGTIANPEAFLREVFL